MPQFSFSSINLKFKLQSGHRTVFDPKVSPPPVSESQASRRRCDTRPRHDAALVPEADLCVRDGEPMGSATCTKGQKRPRLKTSSAINKGHVGNRTRSLWRDFDAAPAGPIKRLELVQHMRPALRIAHTRPQGWL